MWNEIKARKATKQKINSAVDTTRPILLVKYLKINKRVKRFASCDK
jgi:hypothetical protein